MHPTIDTPHRNTVFAGLTLALLLLCATNSANAAVTFVHTDHLGTPVAYSNGAGEIIPIGREYTTPFGETTNPFISNDQPAYTGHMRDSDTGLIYMQARYYDPVAGRFLSVDPVIFSPAKPEHFNRYWYANGNPLNGIDPDGRDVVFAPNTPDSIKNSYANLIGISSTANAMFQKLDSSETIYTIQEGIKSEYNDSNNTISIAQDDGVGLRGKHWRQANLTKDELVSIDGVETPISLEEKIAHEGSHALDSENGDSLTSDDNENGVKDTEERAVKKTNEVRGEIGIKGRRDSYDGVEIE